MVRIFTDKPYFFYPTPYSLVSIKAVKVMSWLETFFKLRFQLMVA